jgi:uncharacterized RDD family membrane protein YckC
MKSAPLARRLMAILYDSFLVLGLVFAGTVPFLVMRGGDHVDPGDLPYQLTLVTIAWAFFTGFWSLSGRTLGMQSWRLFIVDQNGSRPRLTASTIRFFAAILSWLPLGLGFWWQIWDKDKLSWHDRLSRTRLLYDEKTSEPDSTQET